MSATRNGSPVRTANIAIQPASRTADSQTTLNNLLTPASVKFVPSTTISPVNTTANGFATPTSLGGVNVRPTATTMAPIMALAGTPVPFIIPPVILLPKPNPIRRLTESDMVEETLHLDTYTFLNGQAVSDVNSLRCDLISLMSFRPIYDNSGQVVTSFGQYFNDLNHSSNVRSALRKYLIVNRLSANKDLASTLASISSRITSDINDSSNVIGYLDSLIQNIKNINKVLDVKGNLGGSQSSPYTFTTPNIGLRQFVTSRMLFSDSAYDKFSDTKVLYQLIVDLGGMLDKCSFNLLDGFTDNDRRGQAQDAITVDLTYGDNLAYTSDTVKLKYITSTTTFNGILNVLPATSRNRFKFIANMLSRELKVSKGLGKYTLPDASLFSIQNGRGNPFNNILGSVPSDIFMEPLGQNSLATLFYVRTGNNNVIVLPFENRQVVGDNETVFVPGSTYFSDSILKANFGPYNSYREEYGKRINATNNIFNSLLLNQSANDGTSAPLDSIQILKNVVRLFGLSLSLVRKDNNDPNNLLSFVLFLVANGDPAIKFEVYKLLLLIILHDNRQITDASTPQTDSFRDLLLNELNQQNVQGFSLPVTENNLNSLLSFQIEKVKGLILKKIPPLSAVSTKHNVGQQRNTTNATAIRSQAGHLGLPLPTPPESITRNLSANTAQVQVQQFSMLGDALRGEQNLFKNIVDAARAMFVACSSNNTQYHLLEGSSATRYNGLTMSGFLLLIFEMFSNLTDQFARTSVVYNMADITLGGRTQTSQYIELNFVGNELLQTTTTINQFLSNQPYSNDILDDYERKLAEEEQIISNILAFFTRLNQQFPNLQAPSMSEMQALARTRTTNATTLGSTRTAKSILRSFVDKQTLFNPTNSPAAAFYLPSGKVVSSNNFQALKVALSDSSYLNGRRKIITVGIPQNFTNAALAARLNKNEIAQGQLERQAIDIVQVSVHKLDKHDEGLIYKPLTFKFDLSLFPYGFDPYTPNDMSNFHVSDLLGNFQFYDFDEDEPYSSVTAKKLIGNPGYYLWRDPYYKVSPERRALCSEVVKNLMDSFFLDLYIHMTTGLNMSEETFIKYTEEETKGFVSALENLGVSDANYTGVKLMAPVYRDLLVAFKDHPDDFKLMLGLCNDIPSSVFREKMYDRTFNLSFDSDKFAIDTNAMIQTEAGARLLSTMGLKNKLISDPQTGETYKVPDNFIMDQYFINVELLQ